jgi:SNF2 family DNA or RNA helicase
MLPKGRKSLSPWMPDEVEFYQHQIEGVRELVKRRSFILGDEMGLGKSLEALAVFCVDIQRGWAKTAIIISPKTLKWNWVKEIEKFTTIPYVPLEGPPGERVRQLMEYMIMDGPKILLITYEEAYLHREELASIPFDIAVFDEAHYIKDPFARRTKSTLEINSRRSFMLTGTPMLNHISELWCLLHRINPTRYRNYWVFMNRYAVFGGHRGKQAVGIKNEAELSQQIHSVMLRRKKEDVLDLPEIQIIQRRVTMEPEQREIYDQADLELRLNRVNEEDEDIENSLTKFLRLKQICGTTLSCNGHDISAKLDLATQDDMEIVENGHKIVVFTQFREVQECYVKRMHTLLGSSVPVFQMNGDTSARDRQAYADKWSAVSGAAIFVAMMQVASEGITLTAARHGSFLDKWFTPGRNAQARDRLHRIGASTTQPVQIREYLTRKSVEIRIEQINKNKQKLINTIMNQPDRDKKILKLIMEASDDDDE